MWSYHSPLHKHALSTIEPPPTPTPRTFLVVISCLGLLVVAPPSIQLSLVSVGQHPAVIRPAEVTRATETDHKHAIPRLLCEDVVWNVLRLHHLAWPPPGGRGNKQRRISRLVHRNQLLLVHRLHFAEIGTRITNIRNTSNHT